MKIIKVDDKFWEMRFDDHEVEIIKKNKKFVMEEDFLKKFVNTLGFIFMDMKTKIEEDKKKNDPSPE